MRWGSGLDVADLDVFVRPDLCTDLTDAPQQGIQTAVVPAAGGGVFDVKNDRPGLCPFVSHSFASVQMGQVGLLNIGDVHAVVR